VFRGIELLILLSLRILIRARVSEVCLVFGGGQFLAQHDVRRGRPGHLFLLGEMLRDSEEKFLPTNQIKSVKEVLQVKSRGEENGLELGPTCPNECSVCREMSSEDGII